MIHGNCVTIGCIPIGDDPIKELYLVVHDAAKKGGKTAVHIFPTRLDEAGLIALLASGEEREVKAFWRDELAPGYRAFESTRRIPILRVDNNGTYIVRERR